MTWVKPDPFGAAMGTVAGFVTAAGQAKKDKAEADRQDRLDKAAAVTAGLKNTQIGVDTDEARARTTGLINTGIRDTADEARKARQGGDALWAQGGLSPLTMPTAKPGQHISTRDQATQWMTRGTLLTNKGDTDDAKIAFERADKLLAQAKVEDDHALAVKTQAETALQHLAERNHWSAQELQAAKDEVGRMIRAAQDNGTKVEVAAMNGVNAMARTLVAQQGENTRATAAHNSALGIHLDTERNTNHRFNVTENRLRATAATQAGDKGYTRGVEAYNAIAKGERYDALSPRAKASVRSAMVDHGMSVQDAISAVSASNNPDKAAILQALGGQ